MNTHDRSSLYFLFQIVKIYQRLPVISMILSIVQIPTIQAGWRLTVASIVTIVNLNIELDRKLKPALNDLWINDVLNVIGTVARKTVFEVAI